MKIQALGIDGCFTIEHDVFPDGRGLFREWFKASEIEKLGVDFSIAQANFSVSKRGVIRGLHYSLAPEGQSKLVTCVQGVITDVLVDIRTGSPTFMNKLNIKLESKSGKTLFIDSGVAHGFSVLSEIAAVCYLTSSEYSSNYEKSINPHDGELNIDWCLPKGVQEIISESDLTSTSFSKAMIIGDLPNFAEMGSRID